MTGTDPADDRADDPAAQDRSDDGAPAGSARAPIDPESLPALEARFGHLIPGLGELLPDPSTGEPVLSLDARTRALAYVAGVSATTGVGRRAAIHAAVRAALAAGARPAEIAEAIWLMSGHCGTPRAISAMNVAVEIFDSPDRIRS